MKIDVILPVYSETASLRLIVEQLIPLLGDRLEQIILVVHPDSHTETFAIIDQLKKKYRFIHVIIQKESLGVGMAIRQAFGAITGTHVLMMDSDGEMDVNTVPLMMKKMEESGCDMVVASRWMKGGGARSYPPFKFFLNRGFQLIFRILYRTKMHDLTLGFKFMKSELIKEISWDSVFHEIHTETTLRPLSEGYAVEEVPTLWVHRKWGESKNPFLRNFRYLGKAIEILLNRQNGRGDRDVL